MPFETADDESLTVKHRPTPTPPPRRPPPVQSEEFSEYDPPEEDEHGVDSQFGGGTDDLFEIEDIGGDTPGSESRPPSASVRGGALALIDRADEVEEFDPDDLDRVSGYGPIPSSPIDVIKYTLRVRKRTAELISESERIGAGMSQARKELDDVLARLGERAQVAGYESDKVSKLLQEVASADAKASTAQEALAFERRRHQSKIAEFEKLLDALRAKMAQPRQREAKLAGQLGAKQEEARQLDMRIKRLEIEFRNAEELIARHESESTNPEATPDAELSRKAQALRSKLPTLRSQREELKALRSQMDGPLEELTNALEQIRAGLSELRQKRVSINKMRDEEDALHAQNNKRASSQTEEASQKAKSKLSEVGRSIRLEGSAPTWAEELFEEIDEKAEAVRGLLVESRMHKNAAKAFDPQTVKKGYIYMGAGVGLILMVLLLLLVVISSIG